MPSEWKDCSVRIALAQKTKKRPFVFRFDTNFGVRNRRKTVRWPHTPIDHALASKIGLEQALVPNDAECRDRIWPDQMSR